MSTPQVPVNLNPAAPTLADVLQQLKKDVLLSLNSHHIGTIQSFNAEQQTATATINYKQTYFVKNDKGQYVPQLQDYPAVVDCPVISLGGGKAALTFPIAVGDECLILFNDRDLNNWFMGNSNIGPQTSRLHSFADGLILVGVRSLATALGDFDTVRAGIRSRTGVTFVGVNPDSEKVLIANSGPLWDFTLRTLLQLLCQRVQELCTACTAITVSVASTPSTSSTPLNSSSFTDIVAELTDLSSGIGELLE